MKSAAIILGDHHAGTTQSTPSNNATKNRGPKPKGNLPKGSRRAAASGGAKGRRSFIARYSSFPCDSFWHFDDADYLLDDLIRSQPLKISFRLEQDAVAEYRERGIFYIVGQ